MADRDIVQRVADMFGTRLLGPYMGKNPLHKPRYLAQVNGKRAAAMMMTLYTWLGERRKEKARAVLEQFRNS